MKSSSRKPGIRASDMGCSKSIMMCPRDLVN
jgi:hypothetical protein